MKNLAFITFSLLALSFNSFANGCDGETNGRNDLYSSVDLYACTQLLGTNPNIENPASGKAVNINSDAEICISDYTVRNPGKNQRKKLIQVTSNINDEISHDRDDMTFYTHRNFSGNGFNIHEGRLASEYKITISNNGTIATVKQQEWLREISWGMLTCTKTTVKM